MYKEKNALILGAGGFIGEHIAKHLVENGWWVRGADIKKHEHKETSCNDFIIADLRDQVNVRHIVDIKFDMVFQLAADMGGAGYINTNLYDADVMNNSATINLNILDACYKRMIDQVFFSSSACVYNEHLQSSTTNPDCREDSVYPANPDSEYGWEKLFSERLFLAYNRQHGMKNKVARFHNIFGEYGTWRGGKEKSPAAICRKIAMANDGDEIEIWGDGEQTRTFLHVDDCVDAVMKLMMSNTFNGPVNIGSEQMVSINQLVDIVAKIANKKIVKKHVPGPQGVRGRTSNNELIRKHLKWKPKLTLEQGMRKTYKWIETQVNAAYSSKKNNVLIFNSESKNGK